MNAAPTSPIPFQDFGGDGPELLFMHANGHPPNCYRPLLGLLAQKYHVTAMWQRPLWEGSQPDLRDWEPLTADFLRFLDERQDHPPEVIVGHSMGGIAALRAALREPHRFKRLILLDPVLLQPWMIAVWNLALIFNFGHKLHPHITSAQNRRREFDDLESLFTRYRGRAATLKYMSDELLRVYIAGITRPKVNGGYELAYSPEWESRVYYASIWHDMDIWRGLPGLKVPLLIIRGAQTDTFFEKTGRMVMRRNPAIRVETIDQATHLVPLEQPQKVSELIFEFLEKQP